MNENSLASTISGEQTETSIFENPYEKEVQLDIWQHERKKTMYALFIIGALFFGNNGIGLNFDLAFWLEIVLVPMIFFTLGSFAYVQPMIAAITGILVTIAIAVSNYVVIGPVSLITGWLLKAIVLYFTITSVRHARDAEKAKRELQLLATEA